MARIVITRPNGETEYAALTTDKAQAGNDRLAVEKAGTTYYAKLDSGVSTHMFVIKPDGRKLYVQKEVKFAWKYTVDGNKDNALKMVIPRTGKYKITFKEESTHIFPNNVVSTRTKTTVDIFEQGARFNGIGSQIHIKARNDDKYWLYAGKGWGTIGQDFSGTVTSMIKMEYIGEA